MRGDRFPGDDDRGQLILVTGLAVAVTLVAMVLLLNTVIYTQNLATRGAQIEDGEAIAFRGEVIADVGGLLDAENRKDHGSWSEAESNVRQAMFRYDHLLSRYHAERGTVAEIDRKSLSLTEGVILRQTNASRNFTNASGQSADWQLAEDAENVRNVRLTVSGENLSDSRSDSFHVRLAEDDGPEWHVYLYNDTDDEIVVAVKNGSDSSPTDVCSASGPMATVDLTRGTLDGSPCPGLVWAKDIDSPYNVTFRNSEAVTGTYEMTVDPSNGATINETNFDDAGATESPRAAAAVYAAEFEIHFETPQMAFHTTVRTAPGEPR